MSMVYKIQEAQISDPYFGRLKSDISKGKCPRFIVREYGMLCFQGHVYAPDC